MTSLTHSQLQQRKKTLHEKLVETRVGAFSNRCGVLTRRVSD